MEVFLALVFLLVGAKLGGFVASRLKQSAVLGELLAGVLMGPYVLGIIHHGEFLKVVSDIGVVVLMFLAGLHIDESRFRRFMERGFVIAFLGATLPLLSGYILGLFLGLGWKESLFVGGVLSATSVSVTTRALSEMRRLRSDYGTAIMDASVIDDVIGMIILTILMMFLSPHSSATPYSLSLGFTAMSAFFLLSFIAGKKLIPPLLELGRHLDFRVREGLFSIVLALLLLFSFAAFSVGLSIVTGAFILGLIMPKRRIARVEHEVYAFGYGFAIPAFFVYMGSFLNPVLLIQPAAQLSVLLLFSVAALSKFSGSSLGGLLTGFGRHSSAMIGIGMIPRMEIAIVMAELGKNAGILSLETFSLLITTMMLTVFATPFLLKAYRKLAGFRG